MKRIHFILTLLLMSLPFALDVRGGIREVFTELATPTLEPLDRNERLDMLDYFDSGLATPVTSALGEACVITSADDNSLCIDMGAGTTVGLYMLKAGKDSIVMQITDLSLPAVDSAIEFYNTDSQPLSLDKFLPHLCLSDWTARRLSADEQLDLENNIGFIMYKADYDAATGNLVLTGSFSDYLPEESVKVIEKFLKPQLTLHWSGKKFKLVK